MPANGNHSKNRSQGQWIASSETYSKFIANASSSAEQMTARVISNSRDIKDMSIGGSEGFDGSQTL